MDEVRPRVEIGVVTRKLKGLPLTPRGTIDQQTFWQADCQLGQKIWPFGKNLTKDPMMITIQVGHPGTTRELQLPPMSDLRHVPDFYMERCMLLPDLVLIYEFSIWTPAQKGFLPEQLQKSAWEFLEHHTLFVVGPDLSRRIVEEGEQVVSTGEPDRLSSWSRTPQVVGL